MKKISAILLLFIGITNFVFAQEDRLPEFPGGNFKMSQIIQKNLVYPTGAVKDSVQGKIYVSFTIDTLGNPVDVQVTKGLRADCDNEALRVVKLLTGWQPGIYQGKKSPMKYAVPIKFSLK